MRILYSFPHAIGAPGIGTTAINQVIGLIERGHDVTVIAASLHRNAPDLATTVLKTMVFGGARVPHRVLGMDRTMAYHDFRTATHLRRNPSKYDIVHCWPGATLMTAKAASELCLPVGREVPNTHTANAYEVVAKLCADLDIQLPQGHSHRANLQRLAKDEAEYDAATFLLVPSDHVADTFIQRGYSSNKLFRHQYGYDPIKFRPPTLPRAGTFRAAFVGSVEPRKGLHIALEAWKTAAVADAQLSIFGSIVPGYERVLEKYRGLPNVSFIGFTNDIPGALQASDALLLPSFEEGSALVTYEAQGCGTIPLVSDAAGAHCIDGETGLIHKSGDVQALIGHLRALASSPELRQSMQATIEAQRSDLTWSAAAARLENCYAHARSEV